MCREEWMVAIQSVADRIAEYEDVEMKGASMSQSSSCSENNYLANVDEFSAKFSLQGTSSSKSSGKRKVVSELKISYPNIYEFLFIFFFLILSLYYCIQTPYISDSRKF